MILKVYAGKRLAATMCIRLFVCYTANEKRGVFVSKGYIIFMSCCILYCVALTLILL